MRVERETQQEARAVCQELLTDGAFGLDSSCPRLKAGACMKALLTLLATLAVCALRGLADDTKPDIKSEPIPEVTQTGPILEPVPRGVQFINAPIIRADLLCVSGPEEIIVPLLPELRQPAKVQQAQDKLLALVREGKVKLRSWSETNTQSGTRATAESITEFRYPVEWSYAGDIAIKSADSKAEAKTSLGSNLQPVPASIETRNVGTTLDVEPVMGVDGETIQITQMSQAVFAAETLNYYAGENAKGEPTTITEQQFSTVKSNGTIHLKSGERRLLTASKPKQKTDEWYLLIFGAEVITPAKAR
jgi:hypothetical protein